MPKTDTRLVVLVIGGDAWEKRSHHIRPRDSLPFRKWRHLIAVGVGMINPHG